MKKVLLVIIVMALVALLGALAGNMLRQESRQLVVAAADEIAVDAAAAAARLGEAIRYKTISHQDPARFDGAPYLALHDFLARSYPRAHQALRREVVNDYSLLYTWPGSEPELKPILLLGHLDVVPVDSGSEDKWTHPAFSGQVAGGHIWGRGALDDKVSVLGALAAVEYLLAQGFVPKRAVHLAFGHDEEVGGGQGAARIAALLAERELRFDYTLDEGLVITQGLMPGVEAPVALIGLGEKGYVSLELVARARGGHSSMPPPHTAAGLIAGAVHALESNPMPARIEGPVAEMFDYVGSEMTLPFRVLFTNRWLFAPLIEWQLSSGPATNALIRTTTAPTMLSAGVKENVLPVEARAVVNFRILPGDSIARVADHVRDVVDDPAIEIRELPGSEPSPVADSSSASFRALHKTVAQVFPDVVVAPGLSIAATDSRHYSGISDSSYRFLPLRLGPEDLERIHGTDERIAIDNYADIIRFYIQLIRNTAS